MRWLAILLTAWLAGAAPRAPKSELEAVEQIRHDWLAGARRPWMERVLWMVDHYPGSALFRAQYALWVLPPGTNAADDNRLYAQLGAAWLHQVERNPAPQVIANAVWALEQSDFDAAESLLMKARQLYPADPRWTHRLANLYVCAVDPSSRHQQLARPELITPEIAERVKSQLENSTDAALLQAAGDVASFAENAHLAQFFGPSLGGEGLPQRLLARAKQLDPAGFELRQRHPADSARPGSVQPVNLIRKADPVYPEAARNAHLEGSVQFHVLIRVDGRVEELRVLSGDPLLVPAAREAVRQWRYAPALLNGEPVALVALIGINFTLSH